MAQSRAAPIKLSSPATHEFWEVPVLFEDDHLLALDKPAGLLTAPDHADPGRPSLRRLLHAGIAAGKPWATGRGLGYLSPAHRLEGETSGLLLLAKSKPVLAALVNRFGAEQPVLRCLALVQGAPRAPKFEIAAQVAPHPTRPGLVLVDPRRGKRAHTRVEVLETFRGYALLQCEPLTDRPHQMRVHLRHVGLPLVGDALYGGRPLLLSRLKPGYRLKPGATERPLLGRTALHAAQLTLAHPVTGEVLTVTAPWPKDLTVAVKYLRRFAAGF